MLGMMFCNNFLMTCAGFLKNSVGLRKFSLQFLHLLTHKPAKGCLMILFRLCEGSGGNLQLVAEGREFGVVLPFQRGNQFVDFSRLGFHSPFMFRAKGFCCYL